MPMMCESSSHTSLGISPLSFLGQGRQPKQEPISALPKVPGGAPKRKRSGFPVQLVE